jgi:hypothetical protein
MSQGGDSRGKLGDIGYLNHICRESHYYPYYLLYSSQQLPLGRPLTRIYERTPPEQVHQRFPLYTRKTKKISVMSLPSSPNQKLVHVHV